MITKKGINASPGVAIGPALVLDIEEYRIPGRTVEPGGVAAEIRTLDAALETARQELNELRVGVARKFGEKAALIFALHEAILADRSLRDAVVQSIEKNRYTAAHAFGQEMKQRQRAFRNIPDEYLRERVRDLYDVEKRVLRHILGRRREDIARLTEPVVIVAHDITPSQAVSLDPRLILGFALDVGGQTSHTAIIARMLGIPAVVALTDITSDVAGGETVVVDGVHGIVVVNPDPATAERYRRQQAEYRAAEIRLAGLRDLPAVTRDGTRVTLLANIELAEETRKALEYGAEGIGLYRSEFLFLSSSRPPTEEHQYEVFRSAVRHVQGRPIVIRTVDLGADKMLGGAGGSAPEQNPVLGLRSLRFCLQHMDLFKSHLRAILRASAHGDVRIMFPMITTLLELRQAKSTLTDVMEDLEEDGIAFRRDIPVGIMVETPAAAMLAASLAAEVDFLSIGTNDLTQYTLAVDRANERVAHLYCPHNPAVLRLIQAVIDAGQQRGKLVNLCGEMAGEPLYTQLLVGMGLRQLSMAPKDIPEVKRVIRSTTIERCQRIAQTVMQFDQERQVMNFLRDELHGSEDF